MSIQSVPSVPFAQIANSALRDKRLSFKARGVLALVLSNVGEWNATLNWLVAQSDHDGRAATQAALNELTELGYRVVSKESHGPDDIRTVVTWHHVPEDAISRPMTNSTVENLDGRETGASLEHHSLEHYSKEDHEVHNPGDHFAEFWKAYPRKKDKGHAEKAWTKAVKETDPSLIIHAAIQFRQWCQQEQREAQFIPHASTWLNGKRWLDERDPVAMTNTEAHLALVREMLDNDSQSYPQLEG